MTVVGTSSKCIGSGFTFRNTFRHGRTCVRTVEDVLIENPAYDATPTGLVDEVITDDGVLQF